MVSQKLYRNTLNVLYLCTRGTYLRYFPVCFLSATWLISIRSRPRKKMKMAHSRPLNESWEGSKHITKCNPRRTRQLSMSRTKMKQGILKKSLYPPQLSREKFVVIDGQTLFINTGKSVSSRHHKLALKSSAVPRFLNQFTVSDETLFGSFHIASQTISNCQRILKQELTKFYEN